jgi:hypothetical protein
MWPCARPSLRIDRVTESSGYQIAGASARLIQGDQYLVDLVSVVRRPRSAAAISWVVKNLESIAGVLGNKGNLIIRQPFCRESLPAICCPVFCGVNDRILV